MTAPTDDLSRFDRDPDALAWARAKLQREIDWANDMIKQCDGDAEKARPYKAIRWAIRRDLIGQGGCVVAAFDERLPQLRAERAECDRQWREDNRD